MNKSLLAFVCVCSACDEQAVSGLFEVPASISTNGGDRKGGKGGMCDSQKNTTAKISRMT